MLSSALLFAILAFAGCSGSSSDSESTPVPASSQEPSRTPVAQSGIDSFRTGMESFRTKDFEVAASDLASAAESDPDNYEASYYLGLSLVELDRGLEAENAFKQAIDRKPDYAEAHYELGRLYFGRKEYEKSLPHLKEANKFKRSWPDALILLGDNYRALKQFGYAAVPYGRAIGIDENRADAYYGMGMNYIELGNTIAARQQLRKLEPLDAELANELREKIGDQ